MAAGIPSSPSVSGDAGTDRPVTATKLNTTEAIQITHSQGATNMYTNIAVASLGL